eukprot:2675721-Pyramimonas_sp.AAC.1
MVLLPAALKGAHGRQLEIEMPRAVSRDLINVAVDGAPRPGDERPCASCWQLSAHRVRVQGALPQLLVQHVGRLRLAALGAVLFIAVVIKVTWSSSPGS